jgi:hypothetical protein
MFFLTFIRFESKKFFPFRNKTFNLICKIDQLLVGPTRALHVWGGGGGGGRGND